MGTLMCTKSYKKISSSFPMIPDNSIEKKEKPLAGISLKDYFCLIPSALATFSYRAESFF